MTETPLEIAAEQECDMDRVVGLYVHIPFCQYRCSYCDFATFADQDHQIPSYVEALKREVLMRVPARSSQYGSTVFFGGGTPSRLPATDIAAIMETLKTSFIVSDSAEVTLEANPGTLGPDHLRCLLNAGVNRLSVGVQSLNDRILAKLNRIHNAHQAIEALRMARESGFRSINADLIFGLPGQDQEDWEKTLRGVLSAGPDHLSIYGLIVEPGTLLRRQVRAGRQRIPTDDASADMYDFARDLLSSNGYVQYEVSNWARPGHECRHNLIYWEHEPYFGFGLSAHSFVAGRRHANVRGLQGYINAISRSKLPTASDEPIDVERARADAAMLGLRLMRGIHTPTFNARFGGDFVQAHESAIERLSGLGLLECVADYVRLAPKGYLLANQVWQEFI